MMTIDLPTDVRTTDNQTTEISDAQQTILVIDDEIANLQISIDSLRSYGYKVLTAKDGTSGLQRAQYVQPDLILLDVILPDMLGFEICKELKADALTREIPVIISTVLSVPEHKMRAFESGASDYVTKPLQWEEVMIRINMHLWACALEKKLRDVEQQAANRAEALLAENHALRAQLVQLQNRDGE